MAGAKVFCDAKINGKKVVIFSKHGCPHCSTAKTEFNMLIEDDILDKSEYEVVDIGSRPDCGEIQNYLKSITGARTVPRVFVKGTCIGGGSETRSISRNGKLAAMVK